MTFEEYQAFVRSRAKDMGNHKQDLIHAGIGFAGEAAGELLDQVKKYAIYGKELDRENMLEELGDSLFYFTMYLQFLGFSLDEIMVANFKKLMKRYPEDYTDKAAIARADKS